MKKRLFVVIGAIISLGYVGSAEADKAFLKALQDTLAKLGNPWIAGETELSNLSPEEKRRMCGCLPSTDSERIGIPDLETVKRPPLKNPPPTDMDWRDYNGGNWMTSAKNQNIPPPACGACWAFAWVSAQEARMKIKAEDADWGPDLSEQFVVSCNSYGHGCDGGNNNLGGWIKQTGIPDEACYPYRSRDRTSGAPCSDACSDWETRAKFGKITDWGHISEYVSANALKEEIMRGPVVMAVDMQEDFFYYKEGVYKPIMGKMYGHSICVCGWRSSDGAWLCKNSWGTYRPYFWYDTQWYIAGAWMDPDVKPDTGTPIIWTTDSLKFVFDQKGKSSSSPSSSVSDETPFINLGSILLDGEHILEPSLIEASKHEEDTIKYDNSDGGIVGWHSGEGDGSMYWGVRFTPSQECNVVAGLHGIYTESSIEQKLILRDDNGGNPGTTIEEVTYNTVADTFMHWARQDLPTPPHRDANDFWLVYYGKTSNISPKALVVCDREEGQKSYISLNGSNWQKNTANLLIRAVVTYGAGYAGLGTIWVKNAGAGKLTVTDAHSGQGSSWIVSITPKNFNVYKNDSIGIEIGVDTSGLQKDVLYTDEIVVTSNSNKVTTETRVPVTLIINSHGVAEKPVSALAMFKLSPNPFRDKVSISYFVPGKTNVKLVVRDIAGREVAKIVDRVENTGIKKIEWDTKNIPAGIYFCRLTIENSETTRKVLLVK